MEATLNPTENILDMNQGSKLYACDLCPKKYAIIMRFNRHKKEHENGKIPAKETSPEHQDWNCDVCGKSGTSYRSKKRHESTHKVPERKCGLCEKKFIYEVNLLQHQRIHNSETHKCKVCEKWFKCQSNLRIHELTHTDERALSCPVCPKRFKLFYTLKIHKEKHLGETRHKCSKCDKSFISKTSLKHHEDSHQGNQLKCTICSFETPHMGSFFSHKAKHRTKLQTTLFKCDQCSLEYTSHNAMQNHKLIIHNGQKKFNCNQCDFRTGYADSLKGHIEDVHDKIRIDCTICSWKGNSKNLKTHTKQVHFSQKKRFQCNICSIEYSRNEHLKKHINRDHKGVRYSCPNCEHKATTKGGLKVHINSKHEGTRYPCKHCGHKAYCKSSLIKHKNAIHLNLRPYMCNLCEFKASTKSNLKSHEKRSHNIS